MRKMVAAVKADAGRGTSSHIPTLLVPWPQSRHITAQRQALNPKP